MTSSATAPVVAECPHRPVLGLQRPVASSLLVVVIAVSCRRPEWSAGSTLGAARALLVHDLYWRRRRERAYAQWDGRLVPPVLPRRQGDGTARRAVDAARRPGAAPRQPPLQRAAPRRSADVPDPALQAPARARRGRRRGAQDGRDGGELRAHRSRPGTPPGGRGARGVGDALDGAPRRPGPGSEAPAVGHASRRGHRRAPARPDGRAVPLPGRRRPDRALVARPHARGVRRLRRGPGGTRSTSPSRSGSGGWSRSGSAT